MKCRACGNFIPDSLLSCPVCAERRSVVAMRQYQRHPLLLVSQNKGVLTTRTVLGGNYHSVRHVQMFGTGGTRTFCNEVIEGHHRRGTLSFDSYSDAGASICPACRSAITEILAEAAACSG